MLPLVLAACGGASPAPPKPPAGYDFPVLAGRVVDRADILSTKDEAAIGERSERLEATTGHQFVVVTVPTLSGHAIEDYGVTLGRYWGIGRKGIDDGVILIVAPNERMVRIEVGRGLETALTDAEAGSIIDDDMLPAFRAGLLPEGIRKGTDRIIAELSPVMVPVSAPPLKKAA